MRDQKYSGFDDVREVDILVLRHAKHENDLLTEDGRTACRSLKEKIVDNFPKKAMAGTLGRHIQTAEALGLKIIERNEDLNPPDDPCYIRIIQNTLEEMMAQKVDHPWERSFTKAIVESNHYEDIFLPLGKRLGPFESLRENKCIVTSSPLIEVAFLTLTDNECNWKAFKRCRELDGFVIHQVIGCGYLCADSPYMPHLLERKIELFRPEEINHIQHILNSPKTAR